MKKWAGVSWFVLIIFIFTIFAPGLQKTNAAVPTGITLNKNTTSIFVGSSEQLVATLTPLSSSTKIKWASNNESVAKVGERSGLVKGMSAGTAIVTAKTSAGGLTATCTVTVIPVAVKGVTLDQTTMTLTAVGATGILTAMISPTNATDKAVTWSSLNTSVATVTDGVVTAAGLGTTAITVTTEDGGFTATCEVTVDTGVIPTAVSGVTLDQAVMTLTGFDVTGTLIATVTPANATNKDIIWSSSRPKIATVADGVVTPLSPGKTIITVTTVDGGFTAACEVTVEPVVMTVAVTGVTLDQATMALMALGATGTLVATVAPVDATNKTVNWSSSDTAIATVNDGVVTPLTAGTTTITVTTEDGSFTASCAVSVAPAPASPVIQLIGSNPASAQLGSLAYADPGAVAYDVGGLDLTSSVTVTGTVDTTTAGTYTLNYSVTNTATGLTSTITRTVNVVATLDPETIPQFTTPLLIPWAMPKSPSADPNVDYYEIAMRQFNQQILPTGMPTTTVWGYGSATDPDAVFNAPSLTIEAQVNQPVRIKWINDLIDDNGNYLPHLLPIDQTLHWANPVAGVAGRDMAGTDPNPYVGPVPIVTHVHGGHVDQESDGYPEAWYLPAAKSIPAGYATEGTYYAPYKATASSGDQWTTGSAVFDYPNDQSASTIWYHDHALGMTRTNVYTGPAGFYLLRGGATDQVYADPARTTPGTLPTVTAGTAYEIPIAIQDRSFNEDGSLFYPDSRSYFDDFTGPYVPDSDIAPIWNPEFFGNTIIANGNTWPYQTVERKQYRLRLLNGSQSRTLILKLSDGSPFWQIGSDGGFLAQPVQLTELLMGPAERADVIVDFSSIPEGTSIVLQNIGPDGPFQGGVSGVDFDPADPETTGKVMEFRVVAANGADLSTPVSQLVLPVITPNGTADNVRQVSLNEEMSAVLPDEGPKAAKLGTVMTDPDTGLLMGMPMMWMDPITETVNQGDTETWEIYNFTMDAHPIHLHLVTFEVIERQDWDMSTGALGAITPAQSWETGFKDTVLAYPGQITRIKAKFDKAGRYVWHCHILEHEDNEMMRPYLVEPAGADTTAPVITVLGNNPENVALNSVYNDAGATALDDVDGDVTANIIVSGSVNTGVAGIYMIHYTVTDTAGNSAMVMRTVNVL